MKSEMGSAGNIQQDTSKMRGERLDNDKEADSQLLELVIVLLNLSTRFDLI